MLNKTTTVIKIKWFIASQFDGIFTWRNLSASLGFLIMMIVAPFIVFSSVKNNIWEKLVIFLLSELVLLFLAIISIKVLGLIPDFKYAWINHLLNWVIVVLVVALFSIKDMKESFSTENKKSI